MFVLLSLFCSADGPYDVQAQTWASIDYNGTVVWWPPAVYKSACQINVQWYPFDEQQCVLKFGSWTHAGDILNLMPANREALRKHYWPNGEWYIRSTPCLRNTRNSQNVSVYEESFLGHFTTYFGMSRPEKYTKRFRNVGITFTRDALEGKRLSLQKLVMDNKGNNYTVRMRGGSNEPDPRLFLPLADKDKEMSEGMLVHKTIEELLFLTWHMKNDEDAARDRDDYKFLAMVIDRVFLIVYLLAVVGGWSGSYFKLHWLQTSSMNFSMASKRKITTKEYRSCKANYNKRC
ncbi:putative neuronal acetylcholine receptor subunit alpha-3 isoform X2 [Apostichopus japonicus]|uniref:Putative neuronal acetylcholine receptor subunit alpha-3 isoform X2 n=1 Tax=Stichopus japonicus TaxID=307972 RepID=A0A2G8LHY2_STIJA|nr:putative neuronal acetylcholine receptor subunit alpha-3 isoform X2 [Apostichopus japonicus]